MIWTRGATELTLTNVIYPVNRNPSHVQSKGIALDGTARVYDFATDIVYLTLSFYDDHDQIENIRNFLKNTVKFSKETFTMTPDSNQDWGEGDGGTLSVRFWADNYQEIQSIYHRYNYSMLFKLEQELIWDEVAYVDDIDEMLGSWGGT